MEIVTNQDASVPTTSPAWNLEMRRAVRDLPTLCRMLKLPGAYETQAARAAQSFALFAPIPFIEKMRIGDPADPLLRQVLPIADELSSPVHFSRDPLREASAELTPGLLQKYHGRALLVTTGSCAIHCRYCFRRHFPYGQGPSRARRWEAAIEQIADDTSIEEVLLSGGDPLTLQDEDLAELTGQLSRIPHVHRLRIHTRLPIVIPQRVNADLLAWLAGSSLATVVVVHANHPNELQEDVSQALEQLVQAGITVLNQAVLLRGVNDCADTQERLCRALINLQVIPYYLHQMDRVQGAAHFETSIQAGIRIVERLRERLPGYAVPRYVRELPGEAQKTVLA